MAAMDDRNYAELLNAVIDLRSATELGFVNVHRRFDEHEGRWERRFGALETRVETGFREVDCRFTALEARVETGFREVDCRFTALEARVDRGFHEIAGSFEDMRGRLSVVEQRSEFNSG